MMITAKKGPNYSHTQPKYQLCQGLHFSFCFCFSLFCYFTIYLDMANHKNLHTHTQYPLLNPSSYLVLVPDGYGWNYKPLDEQTYTLNLVDHFVNNTVNENKPCNRNQLHKHGSNSAHTQENKHYQPKKIRLNYIY